MIQPAAQRFVMEPRLDDEIVTLNDAIDLKVDSSALDLNLLNDVEIASPADKETLQYELATATWKNKVASGGVTVGATAPSAPIPGDVWFNSVDGTMFVYYSDADSTQWVEARAPITASGYISPNYVINGAFDVWQRGTTFTPAAAPNSNTFSADRWRVAGGGATNLQRTFTQQASGLTSFQYCARAQRPSTRTGTVATGFLMDLESVNSIPLAGQVVTLSFYARDGANFSAASSVMTSTVYTGTGTDQNLTTGYTGVVTATKANTLTTTWTRFSQVVTIPANATQIGIGLTYVPVGTAGTNDYFEVTGVQLESGAVASTFRRNTNSIEAELSSCQRYYTRLSAEKLYSGFAAGISSSAANITSTITLPTQMRLTPTAFDWSGTASHFQFDRPGVAGYICSSTPTYSADASSPVRVQAVFISSGLTAGWVGSIVSNNNTSAYIGFSAEL